MNDAWIPIVLFATMFATIAYGYYVVNRRRIAEVTARTEVQNRLLEKFGSSAEFVQFLQTDAGKSFLSPMAPPAVVHTASAYDRILRTLKTGVILTIFGAAGIILALALGEDDAGVILSGLLLALGVGFLVSAGLSYRLSRAWHLISPPEGGVASGS